MQSVNIYLASTGELLVANHEMPLGQYDAIAASCGAGGNFPLDWLASTVEITRFWCPRSSMVYVLPNF